MKILFKNKIWIAVQSFFFVIGIIGGIALEKWTGAKFGALGAAFNIISQSGNMAPGIFLILFSDLALNKEILQGTFMTHVLMGKSQREWFLRRFSLFTLFIVIQFFLFAFFIGLGDFLVTWHLFNVIPPSAQHLLKGNSVSFIILTKNVAIELLSSLSYVSLAVFVSTLFPGKLFWGAFISIGGLIIEGKLLKFALSPTNKIANDIISRIFITNFDKSWWIAVIYILGFWGLSYLRIGRIKLTNQGV